MAALASSAFSMLRLFSLPYGWGDHELRGSERQRFHVLHSIQDGFRSALLHRQFLEVRAGPRSTTRTRLPAILAPALNSLVWLGSLSRCLRAFNSLTVFSDSSASPSLRLPGLLHYREGFTPLTVAPTAGPPVRRMLPWSTCGHTQGLVRNFFQPSSTECNFMSQLTVWVRRSGHVAQDQQKGENRSRLHPIVRLQS